MGQKAKATTKVTYYEPQINTIVINFTASNQMIVAHAQYNSFSVSYIQKLVRVFYCRCDTALRSPAGHTAVELAAFYRHRDTHALLSQEQSTGQNNDIFFCGNPLNR